MMIFFSPIVRSAIESFGRNSYKEANTEDIARSAGMSKGLLFFYFRNKSSLYLRVMEYLYRRVLEDVVDESFFATDDFFDLLLLAGQKKLDSLSRWPWATEFCLRAFYPDHQDIRDVMNTWNREQFDIMHNELFSHVNLTKFRDDVDPRGVLNTLIMLGDDYFHSHIAAKETIDLTDLLEAYENWCDMLRSWSYKPEYLSKP